MSRLHLHDPLACPSCRQRHATLFCPTPFDRVMAMRGVRFYQKQELLIDSVDKNDETIVVAGNQLG